MLYMLSALFQSKSRLAILSLLLINKFRGSIRAIGKEAKCSPMQARSELINLEKIGIVKSETLGNAKIYSANEKCSFLDELRALLLKTTGYEFTLKEAIGKLKNIRIAFIYGSYATGEFSDKSDLDFFVIGTPDMRLLDSAIFKLQKEIGREINVVVYPQAEFDKRKSHGFIKNVLANKKIFIIGDENGLG